MHQKIFLQLVQISPVSPCIGTNFNLQVAMEPWCIFLCAVVLARCCAFHSESFESSVWASWQEQDLVPRANPYSIPARCRTAGLHCLCFARSTAPPRAVVRPASSLLAPGRTAFWFFGLPAFFWAVRHFCRRRANPRRRFRAESARLQVSGRGSSTGQVRLAESLYSGAEAPRA